MADPTRVLPCAHGGPVGSGRIKTTPDDFAVEEVLGFEPSDEGEHVFLRIEKRGENTDYVARLIARLAGVKRRDIGYAGLKDRHGRTVQWFSVQLPGQAGPDWRELESATVRVLDVRRNRRKLRRGATTGNRFDITIRELAGERADLEQRLAQIAERGVPNYFGAQRFGHAGQNLDRALELFAGTGERPDSHQRGLYLSAARAAVFNRILAERVSRGTWDQALSGDAFMFPDSHSFFKPEALTDDILNRVAARAIHPSGALWGQGEPVVTDEAAAIETAVAEELAEFCRGLEQLGLERSRRPLRVCPENLAWTFADPETLNLAFRLPAGAYATAVIRELVTSDFSD
jgi:tRNA pseudouridine13 synthase